ncbi:synaptobrevin [Neocallimastix lanati (nom. inval.)]|nr:synaptobrevin [Neocallimastix sp. JGI-2020a]
MSQKIGNVQKEFDEVAYTIHNNVNKLAERGEKVYSLQIKSEEFNEYSKQYKYNSEEVKRKIWYKDLKVIAIIILIILLIVFFVLFIKIGKNNEIQNDN